MTKASNRDQAAMFGEVTARMLTEVLPNTTCEQDYDDWARIAYRGALYAAHYAENALLENALFDVHSLGWLK